MFKIYTTFALMEKGRNIFLKIFLLIVLLFFHGINAHSNNIDTHQYYMEISLDTDNIESRLTPDNDSSVEDQIDQDSISDLSEQPECQKYVLSTPHLLNILFFSIWQPPRVF
jgi:hypothetical protein